MPIRVTRLTRVSHALLAQQSLLAQQFSPIISEANPIH